MNRHRLPKFLTILILAFGIGLHVQHLPGKTQSKYYCPMCAGVQSDDPGACPNCGMKLVSRSYAGKTMPAYSLTKRINFPKKTVDGYEVAVSLSPLVKPDSIATHRVEVLVTKHKTRKRVTDADCWFHITYPNGRNLMPHLAFEKNRYTGAIDLRQKGAYSFMAHVNLDEVNVTRVIKAKLK